MISTDIFKGYYIKVNAGHIDIHDTGQKANHNISLWYNESEEAWVLTNKTFCVNKEPIWNSITDYGVLDGLVGDSGNTSKFGWGVNFYPEFKNVLLKYFCSVIQDTAFSYHVCRLYKKGKHGLYDTINEEICPILTAIFDEFAKAAFYQIRYQQRAYLGLPDEHWREDNKWLASIFGT